MTADVVIAIDGPAGSGKSTVGAAVARRVGLQVLDTGAMYRAVTALVLRSGTDPGDVDAVAAIAAGMQIELGDRVVANGVDLTGELRSEAVNEVVSVVSANPAVRAALVERQRAWVEAHHGGVVEGRDIGSVVFPDATVRIFLTATDAERQRRRVDEHPDSVARRDHLDSSRATSPLVPADGARVLDTTGRTIDDVVDEVLGCL